MELATEDNCKDNAAPENNNDDKSSIPSQSDASKKSKRDDRNKKDDKNIELLMKSLNCVPTLEEKLSLVSKKYVQAMDDNKKMQFYMKQSDKRYALLLKEKEQLQHEFNKTVLVKSKLENLCRELQKQNKAIKEASLLKIREEEEHRKETQAKFQNTLSEITALLQQNNEKNAKLRDDNISMTEKFKSVVQQYQLREEQVDKMAKQMVLESQLSDAKLQKASLEHQAEKERLTAEMEQLKVTLAQCRTKIMEMQGQETSLKGQLAIYTDKYDEFQNALVKSNQVFGGFKEEMEKMSKKIKKLEKESLSWKQRWETSQNALLEMCSERQVNEERSAGLARQHAHMQGLCRTLQAERTLLLNTLKEHNIERPPLPVLQPPPAPAPVPAPSSKSKVDAMAANCAQLKESLAHLQNHINVLTNKSNEKKEEPPKQEKSKRSKSKKNKQKENDKNEVKDNLQTQTKETDDNQSNIIVDTPDETLTASDLNNQANDIQIQNSNEVNNTETNVDKEALETLIQAISEANINISLENEDDNKGDTNNVEQSSTENKNNETNENQEESLILDSCPNEEAAHIVEIKPIPKIDA